MSDENRIKELEKELKDEKAKSELLAKQIDSFNLPSKAKLFYALNKQQNDLADLLNKVKIKDIDMSASTDKTIERLKIIWASIGTLAPIVDTLRNAAGITGDENRDMANRKPFNDRIADERA